MRNRLVGAVLIVSLLLPVLAAGALLPQLCGMCASTCCCRPPATDGRALLSCPSSGGSEAAPALTDLFALLPPPARTDRPDGREPLAPAAAELASSLPSAPSTPPPRPA